MGMVRFATIGTSKICERFLDALSREPRAALTGCYSRSGQKRPRVCRRLRRLAGL